MRSGEAAKRRSESAPRGSGIESPMETSSTASPALKRSIGPWQAASIVVGTIIGTGVFLKTSTMAQLLGSLPAVIAAWVSARAFPSA